MTDSLLVSSINEQILFNTSKKLIVARKQHLIEFNKKIALADILLKHLNFFSKLQTQHKSCDAYSIGPLKTLRIQVCD